MHAYKTRCEFPVSLFSDEFVGGRTAPEVNSTDLEKSSGGATEQMDERVGIASLSRLGCNTKQKLLEVLVGPGHCTAFLGNERTTGNSNT
jgi:hypothetical protein